MRRIKTLLTVASALCALIAGPVRCSAHNEPVHVKISEVAALYSPELSAFLSDQLGANLAPFDTSPPLFYPAANFEPRINAPIEWIKKGSYYEDEFPRFLNHFYGVTRVAETLTDLRPYQKLFFRLAHDAGPTIDSFTWATRKGFAPSESNRRNGESWQNSREYQYDALTKSSRP